MDTNRKNLLECMERLLAYAEALRLSLKQAQFELSANMALLRDEVTRLKSATPVGAPTQSETVPLAAKPPVEKRLGSKKIQERRSAERKKVNPVLVFVSNPQVAAPAFQGWVIDCSQTGLCLLVDEEYAVDTQLNIRPTVADPNFRWVRVQVKNCRRDQNSYKLGVRFLEKLTPRNLRQFGKR